MKGGAAPAIGWNAGARGHAVIPRDAWGDLRYLWLAQRLDLASPVEALGYVAQLWSWQGAVHTDERPAFVVPVEVVQTILGRRWPAALVSCGLARRVRGADGSPGLHLDGCEPWVRLATRDVRAARAGSRAAWESRRRRRLAREGTDSGTP